MPVFDLSYSMALRIEQLTRGFGRDFWWLRSQATRAAESVPSHLTEGFYSQYSTEYLQCLFRCRKEGREALLHLRFARDVGLLDSDAFNALAAETETCQEQISNLIRSIESKIALRGKAKPYPVTWREEPGEYMLADSPSTCSQPSTINH